MRQTFNAELLVRKRILFLPVLVAILLAVSSTAARAGEFILTVSDGINPTVVRMDATPGISPDQVVYSGTIGSFTITAVGTATYPGGTGAPIQMNFGTLSVRNNSSTAGSVQISLWRSGLSAASLGLSSTVFSLGSAMATGSAASVSFANYIDASNGTSGEKVYSNSFPNPGAINQTSGSVDLLSGQEFSIGTVINFDFTTTGTISASSGLQVRDVPEPTTLLLFGPGVMGFVAFRRRRRSKKL